jgi:hypothetical protein
MREIRLIGAIVGGISLLGLASSDALAVTAFNDPTGAVRDGARIVGIQGTKIRIRISFLLSNDRGRNIKFLRAFKIPGNIDDGGQNPSSAGILRIFRSQNGKFLVVRLRNNFVGDTSFKYEIKGSRQPGGTRRERANVFIRVTQRSPN